MTVQFGNELKLFITTNVDSDGVVDISTLTKSNTYQLLIQRDTFSTEQNPNLTYVDRSSGIDSLNRLEELNKVVQNVGSLQFSTLLNTSSKTGPNDLVLWNSLVSDIKYPNSMWDTQSSYRKLSLSRTTRNTVPFGLLVLSGTTVRVYNSIRISSVSISFDTSNLVTTSWQMNYESGNTIENVKVKEDADEFIFSVGLTGRALKTYNIGYSYANPKLLKVGVYDTDVVNIGSLASTGINISFNNSLVYLENNGIDVAQPGPIFTNTDSYSINGSLSFYTKAPGSFTNQIITALSNPEFTQSSVPTYGYLIELSLSSNKKLCDIFIPYCVSYINSEFSTVLSNTITFKHVSSSKTDVPYIKFYT